MTKTIWEQESMIFLLRSFGAHSAHSMPATGESDWDHLQYGKLLLKGLPKDYL